jgi:hypothetical protein
MEFGIEFRPSLYSIEEALKGRVKVIYEDAFSFDFKKEL